MSKYSEMLPKGADTFMVRIAANLQAISAVTINGNPATKLGPDGVTQIPAYTVALPDRIVFDTPLASAATVEVAFGD